MNEITVSKLHSLSPLFYIGKPKPKPEVNNTHLRLYEHNLCPFSARARYAFAAKQITYQSVQVDQDNKAKWHLDLNGGFLPFLEAPDGAIMGEMG